MRPERALLAAAVMTAVAFAGCGHSNGGTGGGSGGSGGGSSVGGGSAGGTGGGGGGTGGGMVDAGDPGPPFAISGKSTVRFKRNIRLTTDFAIALGLPFDTFCEELGQYSCTLIVHPLALGGTDPYGSGLYEPLPFTGATSPLVMDRVALNACSQRAALDVAGDGGTPLIYGGIVVGSDGKMDPTQQPVADAITALYQHALLRSPTADELETQRQLYRDIEATGKPDPASAWMTLSCFSVMTSVENLFY